ncbi:MAG: Uma2 family endonuclease [Candidatus Omnitrophica bacterium]|nr:hypothetical protein [bacterium]NUN96557.1 Uma2 family endonuclease [Candidatus Omnitrophota bacterium]
MPVQTQPYGAFRAEDLLAPGMPEKFVEIIEGELVTMTPAGRFHNRVALRLHLLLSEFCGKRHGLDMGGDNEGFLIERRPDILLSPDASLFRRRPESESPWLEFAPEVAVEVLSPSNTPAEIAYKTAKYFQAGSEQVWIVDPEKRSLEFIHKDGRRVRVEGDEVAMGEGLAEGLEVDLKALFAKP